MLMPRLDATSCLDDGLKRCALQGHQFDVQSSKLRSPWFNHQALVENGTLCESIRLINERMNIDMEAMAGYHKIETTALGC